MKGSVPPIRITNANDHTVNPGGGFVLYWMIAYRRTRWNFSLQRAVDWAKELGKPLVILEALRVGYPYAGNRLHRFILEGMARNAQQLENRNVVYYPYVEPKPHEGKGLLETLSKKACVIITDDFPAFFLPRMVASASRKVPVLMEKVDSNGLLPMGVADRIYPTAYTFRRFLQKVLPDHLIDGPQEDPLKRLKLPGMHAFQDKIRKTWPPASPVILKGEAKVLASLPIDHDVEVVARQGGSKAAYETLTEFTENRLFHYDEKRNQPEEEVTSGLSPYLHFGHISAHEVFHRIMEKEAWFFDRLSEKATGRRSGWWGMSESAEAFLDQL
ncbi:MAG: deoxyribodipyrimidine photolyase, partial [Pseudomonadota bacterium]